MSHPQWCGVYPQEVQHDPTNLRQQTENLSRWSSSLHLLYNCPLYTPPYIYEVHSIQFNAMGFTHMLQTQDTGLPSQILSSPLPSVSRASYLPPNSTLREIRMTVHPFVRLTVLTASVLAYCH